METSDFTRDALRKGIREIYEDNRRMFLEMAARLTDADLSKPSANEEWTIGELMFHIVISLEYVAEEVEAACKGKNVSPMPKAVYDRLNVMLMRQQAKSQNLASILEKYDAAFDAAVKLLDEIGPDDWRKSTKFFYWEGDVIELFRRQRQHHMEHFAQIQQVL